MVSEKQWTKTDPKDTKNLALTTLLSNLEKKKSVLVTVQGGGRKLTQTCTNTKGKDKMTRYRQD